MRSRRDRDFGALLEVRPRRGAPSRRTRTPRSVDRRTAACRQGQSRQRARWRGGRAVSRAPAWVVGESPALAACETMRRRWGVPLPWRRPRGLACEPEGCPWSRAAPWCFSRPPGSNPSRKYRITYKPSNFEFRWLLWKSELISDATFKLQKCVSMWGLCVHSPFCALLLRLFQAKWSKRLLNELLPAVCIGTNTCAV